jgi:hypothetical protein
MDYYEFVCSGAPSMSVTVPDRDPAKMPGAAQACCQKWTFSQSFKLGDGSHLPALDAAIKARVAADGYYIFPTHAKPPY